MERGLHNPISNMTAEQRREVLAKAIQSKLDNIALREANKHLLKLNYLDEHHWHTLATRHRIRMPHKEEATSAKVIRKYLKRCQVSYNTFNDSFTSMSYFLKHNPHWTAFATAGIILELKEQGEFQGS